MFDIGWTELLVIGVVALIVVGPKDLPKMFHTLGQVTAKAKGMAREFQRAMEDAAKDSGMKDVARDLRKAGSLKEMGLDGLDKLSGAKQWDPNKIKSTAAAGTAAVAAKATVPDDAGEAAADALEAELDAAANDVASTRAAAVSRASPAVEPAQSGVASNAVATPSATNEDEQRK
jgi:sec-independent protein translocase protein TatB